MTGLAINGTNLAEVKDHGGHRVFPMGIDFGTTNSVLGRYMNSLTRKGPEIFNLSRTGDVLYPSFIYYDEQQDKFLTGKAAYGRRFRNPASVIRSIKRTIGANQRYTFGSKEYSVVELASKIIGDLIAEIKLTHHELSSEIIAITVPYYFGENQNYCIRETVKLAIERELGGKANVVMLPEPVAAALSCIYTLHEKILNNKTLLIYDIGGGTLDLTLVRISIGKTEISFEVLANEGIANFGGDDVDTLILEYIQQSENLHFDSLSEKERLRDKARLMDAIIELKMQLTLAQEAVLFCSGLYCIQNGILEVNITRQRFDNLLCGKEGSKRNMLQEFENCLTLLLQKAHIQPQDVNILIPVGGSSSILLFNNCVNECFPNAIPYKEEDNTRRFINVARGAAIYAALKSDEILGTKFHPFGEEKSIRRFVTRISHSLFIEKYNEELDNIIPANAVSPYKVRKIYYPTRFSENQERVELNNVRIFQGKGTRTKDCECIGCIDFSEIEIYTHGRSLNEIAICLSFEATDTLVEIHCEIAKANPEGTDVCFSQILHY